MGGASLFVIIPGYGGPNVETKRRILISNVKTIRSGGWGRVHIRICCYDDSDIPPFDSDIEVIRERDMWEISCGDGRRLTMRKGLIMS
jgi:hypothetical protein